MKNRLYKNETQTKGGGGRYPKIVTNGDMGEVVCSNGDVTTAYFLNIHISYISNYFPHVPFPTCILEKQLKWPVVCDSE